MFQKARRKEVKLKLSIIGPSGSGKTYSSLMIAKGFGGTIGLIDTERGSSELYSDLIDYDVAQLTPPYSPDKYIQAIKAGEKYDLLIIDSLSHAWSGSGGILDMHSRAERAVRNSFAAWKEVTPHHNALVDTILSSPCHIITTMRTKVSWEVNNEDGKTKVVKVGLSPIQKENLDYEFGIVFEMSIDGHIATAAKDRTGLFDGQRFVPSEDTGKLLKEWLDGGKGKTSVSASSDSTHFIGKTSVLMDRLIIALDDLGLAGYLDTYNKYVSERYGVEDMEFLKRQHYAEQLALLGQCKNKEYRLKEFKDILNSLREAA